MIMVPIHVVAMDTTLWVLAAVANMLPECLWQLRLDGGSLWYDDSVPPICLACLKSLTQLQHLIPLISAMASPGLSADDVSCLSWRQCPCQSSTQRCHSIPAEAI